MRYCDVCEDYTEHESVDGVLVCKECGNEIPPDDFVLVVAV